MTYRSSSISEGTQTTTGIDTCETEFNFFKNGTPKGSIDRPLPDVPDTSDFLSHGECFGLVFPLILRRLHLDHGLPTRHPSAS